MAPDVGQEHRHQIHRAEQPDAQDEAEQAADRKIPVAKRPQIDQRPRRAQRSPDECAAGDQAQRQQPDHQQRRPAALRRLLDRDLQSHQRARHQDQRQRIEMARPVEIGLLLGQRHGRGDRRHDSGQHVDEEQPMPGIGFGDPAADHGSGGRRQHRQTPAIVVAMVCSRNGNSRKTAENTAGISVPPENPCTDAPQNQCRKAAAGGAGDRRKGKGRDRDDEQPTHGERSRQKAGERDGDDFRDQISGLHPAHLILGDVERVLDRRQRRGDHLHVEDRHEHADAHHGKADPGRNLTGSVWCDAGDQHRPGIGPPGASPGFGQCREMTSMQLVLPSAPSVRRRKRRQTTRRASRSSSIGGTGTIREKPDLIGHARINRATMTQTTHADADSPILQKRREAPISHRTRCADHRAPALRQRLQLSPQERPADSRPAHRRAPGEPRRAAGLRRCRLCQRRHRRRCKRWAAMPPAAGNTAIIPTGKRCASAARPGTSFA